jgi:transketolase
VELTELGQFVSPLTEGEEPSILGNMVETQTGLRQLGAVIKDLRKRVLRMVAEAGSGHLGASLSVIDILAVLYFMRMKHDPSNPEWEGRDRLILSKGHAAPALYAVLSEAGYIPERELDSLRKLGGLLQGHPENQIPGVDASTGSLGQGLSIAAGMALAAKIDEASHKVYAILGDGELDEGQIWEAALTAAHHRLDNLIAIVDRNQFQLSGPTEEVKTIEPVGEKWRSFGWEVAEANGNDPPSILDALDVCNLTSGKPSVIIAHTTKGKGVSFMEGNIYSKAVPDASQLAKALAELS